MKNVDFSEKLVEVSQVDSNGNKRSFYLPYDKLVIAVGIHALFGDPRFLTLTANAGSTTNPHGVQGLENCNFLKSIDDARDIKNKVLQNLELACLPTTSDEERKRLLSFRGVKPCGLSAINAILAPDFHSHHRLSAGKGTKIKML